MNQRNHRILNIAFVLVFMSIVQSHLFAQVIRDSVPELQKIDIVEHLGQTIPLDLTFVNDAGDTVKLGDYFHQGKPVIVTLAYYNCPMLCTMVLNGLSDGIRGLSLTPEKDFTVLDNQHQSHRDGDACQRQTHALYGESRREGQKRRLAVLCW